MFSSIIIIIIVLLIASAFFSASETSLTSMNIHRLKRQAKTNNRAKIALGLIEKPDKTLSTILISNNAANIFATSLLSMLAFTQFGEKSVFIISLIMTFLIIIFAEVIPKTLAVAYPEKISLWGAPILRFLQILYKPIIIILNLISTGLFKLFNIKLDYSNRHHVAMQDLQEVIKNPVTNISNNQKIIISNILAINQLSLEDLMIPRSKLTAIDINDNIEKITKTLMNTEHKYFPIYKEDLNNVVGILDFHNLLKNTISDDEKISKDMIYREITSPTFTPINASPSSLFNSLNNKDHTTMIVDEYGEVIGMVIFSKVINYILKGQTAHINKINDNTVEVSGVANLYAINELMGWNLNTEERTVNGLITNELNDIPSKLLCLQIQNYRIHILANHSNMILKAKIEKIQEDKNSNNNDINENI